MQKKYAPMIVFYVLHSVNGINVINSWEERDCMILAASLESLLFKKRSELDEKLILNLRKERNLGARRIQSEF